MIPLVKNCFGLGRQMAVFNSQSQIQIGGRWNPTLKRVERHFEGIMAGVVYNGLRPLDLAANSDGRTKVQGQVRVLENIPFDYRLVVFQIFCAPNQFHAKLLKNWFPLGNRIPVHFRRIQRAKRMIPVPCKEQIHLLYQNQE